MPAASSNRGLFATSSGIRSIRTRAAFSRRCQAERTATVCSRSTAPCRSSARFRRDARSIHAVPPGSMCVRMPSRVRSDRDRTGWCAASCTTLATVTPPPQRYARLKTMALVEVEHLTKQFARGGGLLAGRTTVTAVDDVSFSIDAGETFGLVGESGSGKTTTGRCLLRLIEPTSGSMRFSGDDVLAFTPERMRAVRRDMQIVFQDPYASLNPRMRAREIVEEPLVIHSMGKRAERQERVAQLFALVGLN